MIERYTLTATPDKISNRFAAEVTGQFKPRYNAAPTQLLPVITSGAGQKGISWFYWGRSSKWANNKSLSEKIINLHAEMLSERPVLKKALLRTRCIIPADGFYIWRKVGKKTAIPYRFTLHDKSLFSIAGIWEEFENEEGDMEHTFSMITKLTSASLQTITERIPVILSADQEETWLSMASTENVLLSTLQNSSEDNLQMYSVSPRINDMKTDVPSLILPAPPADQHGNLTLFD